MDGELQKIEIGRLMSLIGVIQIKDFRSLLLKHIKTAFLSTHKNTNVEFGWGGTKPDQNALDYLSERVFILSDKTASKLTGDLRFQLLEGLKNNESITQITKRLDEIFTDTMPWELERIARTEIVDAQNAGRISAYKASDVVEYKMWVAAKAGKGQRVCTLCASLHGQIQPLDKPFMNPNNHGESWQHPVAHPNGRCTTVPLMDLPDNVITIGGLMYDADEKLGKIEIPIDLLKSQQKRKAWVVQWADGRAVTCFEDEVDADYYIETSKKKDAGWFDFGSKVYREVKSGWSIKKKGTKITFKTDDESRKVNKVDKVKITTESVNKNEREVWVSQTVKRKGHWRTIKIKGDK